MLCPTKHTRRTRVRAFATLSAARMVTASSNTGWNSNGLKSMDPHAPTITCLAAGWLRWRRGKGAPPPVCTVFQTPLEAALLRECRGGVWVRHTIPEAELARLASFDAFVATSVDNAVSAPTIGCNLNAWSAPRPTGTRGLDENGADAGAGSTRPPDHGDQAATGYSQDRFADTTTRRTGDKKFDE
jgi:hypothetical protein